MPAISLIEFGSPSAFIEGAITVRSPVPPETLQAWDELRTTCQIEGMRRAASGQPFSPNYTLIEALDSPAQPYVLYSPGNPLHDTWFVIAFPVFKNTGLDVRVVLRDSGQVLIRNVYKYGWVTQDAIGLMLEHVSHDFHKVSPECRIPMSYAALSMQSVLMNDKFLPSKPTNPKRMKVVGIPTWEV